MELISVGNLNKIAWQALIGWRRAPIEEFWAEIGKMLALQESSFGRARKDSRRVDLGEGPCGYRMDWDGAPGWTRKLLTLCDGTGWTYFWSEAVVWPQPGDTWNVKKVGAGLVSLRRGVARLRFSVPARLSFIKAVEDEAHVNQPIGCQEGSQIFP